MALPGTPGQRISDLCNGNHITQKELAEKIGVSASQLSRIVSGETRTSLNKSSCLKKPVFMRVSAISISLLITN
ncbi:helix-turn-helix domain-containing protein [Bariatricus sp. HCP3S3_E12]|uniref:helix-turn-helix domain-containing protein n=1 Tax=Lachnospiraceae TaxID=186803 RepID=UPI003F8CADE3